MSVIIAKVELESLSPYLQSKYVAEPRKEKELPDAYELRTWKMKAHTQGNQVVIPASALFKSLQESAQYLSLPIPGKNKQTYTKHIRSGVMVINAPVIGTVDDLKQTPIYVSSTGDKKGQGTRVLRLFPTIEKWETVAEYYILDPIITPEVFMRVLENAGLTQGIGAFRPGSNGGWSGRYKADLISWTES